MVQAVERMVAAGVVTGAIAMLEEAFRGRVVDWLADNCEQAFALETTKESMLALVDATVARLRMR
jgi:hypothetical protein